MNDDPKSNDPRTPATAAFRPGAATDATTSFTVAQKSPLRAPAGYEILNLIGRGGMGVVYRARQTSLNRIVAIKSIALGAHLHGSAAARFELEAQTIARLQHPHVVTAYDFGRTDDGLFLVMEFVEGQDLDAFIRSHERLDEPTTLGLLRQATLGLAHAAGHGIVHRDVKPANMLLVAATRGHGQSQTLPVLKLSDFGLAFLADDRRDGRLTQEGTTLGSPHYMAPEQIYGTAVDLRTDIYGLGATAYQMLTGVPPFPGETSGQVFARKLKNDNPPIAEFAPNVSAATCELINSMIHELPASRPQDYETLIARIDELLRRPTALVAAAPKRLNWLGWNYRFPYLPGLLVMALLLGVCGYVVSQWGSRRAALNFLTMVPSGWQEPLFNGVSLAGWLPKKGQWHAAKDSEGGRVLEGQGVIMRNLPPIPADRTQDYRLTVGCDLHHASAAELQFGEGGAGLCRFALRLERDALRFLERADEPDLWTEIASVPLANSVRDEDEPQYVELRAEYQSGRWLVFHDEKPFADAAAPQETAPRMALAAEAGSARFDGPQITGLKPP